MVVTGKYKENTKRVLRKYIKVTKGSRITQ